MLSEHSEVLFAERLFRRERRSVPAARTFVAGVLDVWRIALRRDEVLLCVSELATNAVVHGVPPGRGFRLQLAAERDAALRVEVHDSGSGCPRVCEDGGITAGEGGRGLLLVEAVADGWGVVERQPGKVVWCAFRLS